VKASVYTSLFNYSPDKFDLLGAFKNWSKYADEIVIATFEDQAEDISAIVGSEMCGFWNIPEFQIVSCPDTSLNDPLFDGKLKNAALQACSNELVIQQDLDERVFGSVEEWEYLAHELDKYDYPITCGIQVIDLYKDYDHFKGVSFKFYFHKKKGIRRGVVNYAKRGDYIDISLSDSTEPILEDGTLAPYFVDTRFCESSDGKIKFDITKPGIAHLGYLDLDKRIENNKFWKSVWDSRAGKDVEVATTLEKLEEENEAKPHGLPIKWWI